MYRLIIALILLCSCYFIYSGCCSGQNFHYIKTKEVLKSGKSDNLSEEGLEIEKTLKKIAEIPKCADYFKQFFTSAYLIIEGFNDLCFTVTIKDGKTDLKRGIDPEGSPDLIIPMNKQNCGNLLKILEDGEVSDEEAYRIFYVTFIPSYKNMLRMKDLYNPLVAKKLALPDFMQVVLKNPEGYVYQNTTSELSMTIVNVDGQWLVFKGMMGDPDIRMAVTHQQAGEFTNMVLQSGLKDDATTQQKLALIDKIKKFMNDVTVYRRK